MLLNRRGDQWRVPVFLAGLTLVFYWKVLFTNRAMYDVATGKVTILEN